MFRGGSSQVLKDGFDTGWFHSLPWPRTPPLLPAWTQWGGQDIGRISTSVAPVPRKSEQSTPSLLGGGSIVFEDQGWHVSFFI